MSRVRTFWFDLRPEARRLVRDHGKVFNPQPRNRSRPAHFREEAATEDEAKAKLCLRVLSITGIPLQPEHLEPWTEDEPKKWFQFSPDGNRRRWLDDIDDDIPF